MFRSDEFGTPADGPTDLLSRRQALARLAALGLAAAGAVAERRVA